MIYLLFYALSQFHPAPKEVVASWPNAERTRLKRREGGGGGGGWGGGVRCGGWRVEGMGVGGCITFARDLTK